MSDENSASVQPTSNVPLSNNTPPSSTVPPIDSSTPIKSIGSDISVDCNSCVTTEGRTPVVLWSPVVYNLTSGEYLHDKLGPNQSSKSLASYCNSLAHQNVYRVFYNYTNVLQRDAKKCTTEFRKHPDCNRFFDIPCIDETRVKIPTTDGTHDYLHANYVDGYRAKNKYILSQAPLKNTVDQWWDMIWREKTLIIVCMMRLDEKGCPRYIPTKQGEKVQFGKYTIEHSGTYNVRGQYDATNLHVTDGRDTRHILHFIFCGWHRKGSPTLPTEILNFLSDINHSYDTLVDEAEGLGWLAPGDPSPWILHCMTGVGRSATLVTLDILCKRLDDSADLEGGPLLDVEDTVLKIRTQRAMAIQKPEQYLFIHLIVLEYAIRKHFFVDVDEVSVTNFKMTME